MAALELEAALSSYTPAPGEEELLQRVRALLELPDPFDRSLPLHLTGSAIVVDPAGETLLRYHERLGGWYQVGGHGDPGEADPLAVALREATEECGLDDLRPVGGAERALVQIVIVSVPKSDVEPAHEHADLRYLLRTEAPELAREEHPGAPLRWLPFPDAIAQAGDENLAEGLRRAATRL